MSDNKHTVSTDALDTLGTFPIPDNSGRDAIHLAVEPSIAAEDLVPGQHVGFVEGGVGTSPNPVGIVDPFLKEKILKGKKFWLIVYPRQITSLRHVWSHPEFPSEVTYHEEKDEHYVKQVADSYGEESRKWMQEWANKHMSYDYDDWGWMPADGDDKLSPERAFANAIDAGRTLSVGSYEDARDHINDEWWTHWERITGLKAQRDEHFSCSC